ncbi:hypothetical protein VTO42DRAFT_4426 [Malbranchea cinnamomea]
MTFFAGGLSRWWVQQGAVTPVLAVEYQSDRVAPDHSFSAQCAESRSVQYRTSSSRSIIVLDVQQSHRIKVWARDRPLDAIDQATDQEDAGPTKPKTLTMLQISVPLSDGISTKSGKGGLGSAVWRAENLPVKPSTTFPESITNKSGDCRGCRDRQVLTEDDYSRVTMRPRNPRRCRDRPAILVISLRFCFDFDRMVEKPP